MTVLIVFGVILLITGGILFFVQKHHRGKAFSLRMAHPATVAELQRLSGEIATEIGGGNWQDYVKLTGTVRCDGQGLALGRRPLISELKQEACVHYTMSVSREYEETVTRQDSNGKSHKETRRGSEMVASNQRSIPFYLQDRTGYIEVNPDGAAIETVKILDEFRQEQFASGTLSYGDFSLSLGRSDGNRRTLGYRYTESILPIDRQVLVVAMVSDQTGNLVLQKPSEKQYQFMISLKTEAELARVTARNAQLSRYSMLGCLGMGILMLIIGSLL